MEVATTRADLDPLRATVENLRAAREHERMWRKRAEKYEFELKAAIGEDTEGFINGQHQFSYRRTGVFNQTQFLQDHPDLWTQYARPVTTYKVDVAALEKDHPDLYVQLRGRRFLLTKDD